MCCGVFPVDSARVLSLIPRTPAVMTAAFENKRSGLLVDRVMVCADEPPCIAVSLPKGHRLATLIRDSHTFAISLVDAKQKLLLKKFDGGSDADSFELIESRSLVTGAPCLARATVCIDCDVMRHFDLEADYEMYIGLILATWWPAGQPGAEPPAVAVPGEGSRADTTVPAGRTDRPDLPVPPRVVPPGRMRPAAARLRQPVSMSSI